MKNILDGRKDGQTDRGKTVYPPPPSGSGGIIIRKTLYCSFISCEKQKNENNMESKYL